MATEYHIIMHEVFYEIFQIADFTIEKYKGSLITNRLKWDSQRLMNEPKSN